MVLTTMSTVLSSRAVIRSAEDRMRYSTAVGVPKMSRATSPAMSTSNPLITPVIGSRKENRLLPMSRPTISRPRLRIAATAASASALVGKGRRLAVRSQLSGSSSGGRASSTGSSSIPAGVGGASVGVGWEAGSTGCPQAPRAATASTAIVRRRRVGSVLCKTITDTRSFAATVPARRRPRPRPTVPPRPRSSRTAPAGPGGCRGEVACGFPGSPR